MRMMEKIRALADRIILGAALLALPITLVAVMTPTMRNALLRGDAQEALLPASIVLASYVVLTLFVFILKILVIDDDTTPLNASRIRIVNALLWLALQARYVSRALLRRLRLRRQLPSAGPQTSRRFHPSYQPKSPLTPPEYWPHGRPSTIYG